jgi:cytoskeletal protein RodZ
METSLGAFLKSEREARQKTIQQIAAETKVPEASLFAIESDRLDDLPGEVFVRGFLRAYSRALEIDPETVLARLDRPAPTPILPKVHATDRDLRRRRISSPALLFVLLLAMVLIAIVVWRPISTPSFSAQGATPPAGTAG